MSFLTALAEAEHVALPMPTLAYGVIALVIFVILAAVVWSFRDVSHRHSAKAQAYAAARGGAPSHAGSHGAGH